MLDLLINVASDLVVMTANLGANTMSSYLSYEPELPECLIETEE